MSSALADIALPLPLNQLFTYLLPDHLQSRAQLGMRALVPFGKKHLTGVLVGFPRSTSVRNLKAVRDILDARPTFSATMLRLTQWMADYYFVPWGEVLRAATPQGLAQEIKQKVSLVVLPSAAELQSFRKKARRQFQILRLLESGPMTIGQIRKKVSSTALYSMLRELEGRGWIAIHEELKDAKAKPKLQTVVRLSEHALSKAAALSKPLPAKQKMIFETLQEFSHPVSTREFLRKTRTSSSSLRSLAEKGLAQIFQQEEIRSIEYENPEPALQLTLTAPQKSALTAIAGAIDESRYHTFLLHGVTGSGKTQVYIEAIRSVLAGGKTAIVLVPEISLTPQTVRRFRSHFGSDVALMHSQMSVGERFDAWRMARDGRIRIVIGPRSAVFAPLENLGLIVVDEEHESSYKQYDASPRYNARDVAVVRATIANAIAILGSATPSVESYHNAESGKYHLLKLPDRIDAARLPRIDIVDMLQERKRVFAEIRDKVRSQGIAFPKHLPQSSVSQLLKEQIGLRLQRKEGVILLQNRRGFSHVVECFDCGYVERCDRCDVTLTYHSAKKHLRCHYCGAVKKPPSFCPNCRGIEIRFHAFGTQQVHQELEELFPAAAVVRMDLDTTTRKGAHDRLLQQFGKGEADILLGTQMVAKGLDFPRVTLVGVISADTQMLLPDFRASERTFQLLTQVAGRAGRSNLAGEVVIQTMQPSHYSLKHVVLHDFPGFYREELAYREELDYPPFSRIVVVELKGKREDEVSKQGRVFADLLREQQRDRFFTVLGPADAAIPRIRNLFRKLIVIKD
ncbi:MAG: primosomal protein N', partial [Ignavibacteriales bacterium]|nr:primosomal protein N' [Ignavibacteriales bacterium]